MDANATMDTNTTINHRKRLWITRRIAYEQIWRHHLQEPLERLALQPFAQLPLCTQITRIRFGKLWVPLVQKLAVLVHPYLGDALKVAHHKVNATRIAERCVTAVHVADARTGRINEPSTTLPNFEAQFVLLAAPDV
uniref:Uncharacterized protein n=1 Tax=Anopheles coluzzii TaxID=1518534 RepID=A0A8W7P0Y6_ANOCL